MTEPLRDLVAAIRGCRHCTDRFAATTSAHSPNPILQVSATAKLCIVGQAPGLRAHKATTPFLDPSGDRLRDWLQLSPEQFYDDRIIAILPMAFCFPGYDAKGADIPPPKDCAKLWRDRLVAATPDFPLTLLVGGSAQAWYLPGKMALTERVLRWTKGEPVAHGAEVIPLPHPSWRNNVWLKKNPWFEMETLPKLRSALRAHLPSSCFSG